MEAELQPVAAPPVSPTLPRKRRNHKRRSPALVPQEGLKWGPLTRANLDRRTLGAKKFDGLVAQIRRDLGDTVDGTNGDIGDSTLSAVQLAMIESFAAISVLLDAQTVKLLLNEPIAVDEVCALSSTLVRVGARLGLHRKARTVEMPSLGSYLNGRQDGEPVELPGLVRAGIRQETKDE
jgi:hypothetical protein